MNWKEHIRNRVSGLKLSPAREAEIVEELAQHLGDIYDEARASGVDEDEAQRRALDELNHGALARELLRAERPAVEPMPPLGAERKGNPMADFWQDLRFCVRSLVKSPGFTAVAVLTLALGIGANATIFSWLNAVLLDPLPGVEAAHQLVSVHGSSQAQPIISLSYPDYADYRARNTVFAGLIAAEETAVSMRSGEGEPERMWAQLVSGNFFDVLGVRAIHGRTFLPEEDQTAGTHPVVVISSALWQRRFGGDPGVAGKSITLNNRAFTVVGVAPPDFPGSETALRFDVWVPMMMVDAFGGSGRLTTRGNRWFTALGRLKPGVSVAQAQSEMNGLAAQLAREYPENDQGIGVVLHPLWKSPRSAQAILGPVLLLMMGMAGAVLLIACANVANLLLARATGRRKEIAVRLALGAGRSRLVRQLLTESVTLSLAGGAAGLMISFWTSGLLIRMVPPTDFPVYLEMGTNPRVLLFSLLVAMLTGVVFGLAPALHATRADLTSALKDEAGNVAGGRRKTGLRSALVVAQVSLSLVLLIAAGLFLRSLLAVRTLAMGFNPNGVLLLALDLTPNGYGRAKGMQFYEQLLRRAESVPGVTTASLSRRVPLGFGGTSSTSFHVEGYQPAKDEQVWSFLYNISPNYFRTMEIPIARGREFTFEDREGAPRVAVINETLAARYWPGRDALGGRFHFGDSEWITVVGVARDSKYRTLNEPPSSMIFLSVLQFYRGEMNLHVRTAGNPVGFTSAVQNEIRALDPYLPVYNVRSLEEHIRAASFQQRMAGNLLGVFGLLALLLAAVGIYGLLAYTVSQRTHEIGIRIALGARGADILRLVLRQGMKLTGIGLVIGLGAAFGVTRFLTTLLFGVQPADPLTFAGVALLLLMVAMLACYLPARRATRVDPLVALRYE